MDADKNRLLEQVLGCTREALEMDSDCSDKEEIVRALVDATEMVQQLANKRKRSWVKTWRTDREGKGSFKFLNCELLKDDPSSYHNYLRMDKSKFVFLLKLIRLDIDRFNTQMREAITAEEKLVLTLRFLSTGESFKSMNYQTRLSTAVPAVCAALWIHLKETHLKFPSSSIEWDAISREFAIKWQFPNCLGALDGKLIQFRSPRSEGAFYHNYKGNNSIILLAFVDAKLRFVFVDVGCNGRVNDAGVLQRSELRKVLDDGKFTQNFNAEGQLHWQYKKVELLLKS